jgi:hypothetical protein
VGASDSALEKCFIGLGAPGPGKSFNAGLVRCSVAHTLLMTGCETDSKHILQEARTNMASEARVYWIPLFHSYRHDYITKATHLSL